MDGGFMEEKWKDIQEFEERYQISHISSVCRGKRKSAEGFFWKYK